VSFQHIAQKKFGRELLMFLVPILEAPEPRLLLSSPNSLYSSHISLCLTYRVKYQATVALVRLCGSIDLAELNPHLDTIVERLLRSISPNADNVEPKKYLLEQIIAAFEVIAKKSKGMFAKVSTNNVASNVLGSHC
jgi:hypothetical protein